MVASAPYGPDARRTSIELSATDRAHLEAVVADRNSLQKHVWRAEIVLASADGLGTSADMRRAGVSKPCVWRGQARFMAEGVDGLLRDKTRRPGTPPLPETTVERVVKHTRGEPPGKATHWMRTFKLSRDPQVHQQALRRGRALHEPAGAQPRALGG